MKREKKRGGRGRREEEDGDQAKQRPTRYGTWIFGMETEFMYGFYEIMHEFPCFDGYPLAQI